MKNKYVFIDFEMDTKCDSHPEQIISISAVKTDENGNIIKTFNRFTRLKNKESLYEYTTFLTGIKNNQVKGGQPFNEAFKDLCGFIGSNTKAIYTWGNCDKQCLRKTIKLNNGDIGSYYRFINPMMFDYREYLPKKYKRFYSMNLFKVAKELKLVDENAEQSHSSLIDAKVLKKIYFKIKEDD